MNEQTNEFSSGYAAQYAGSLKAHGEKPKKPGKDDWMKYAYPNRRVRRKFEAKSDVKYKRTKEEIAAGKTPFEKYCEILRGNVEHGNMLHRAFQNEVATDQMHFEQAKDAACIKSLTDAFGHETGMKMHNNNRRLRGIYDDKKIMR